MQWKSKGVLRAGLALGLAIASNVAARAAVIGDDLVLYHKYNDSLTDASGHGNDGLGQSYNYTTNMPQAAAISYFTGKFGQAASVGRPNYITLGDATSRPDFDFGGQTDFSISMWVKYSADGSDPVFIGNKNWTSGGNPGWVIARDGDERVQFNFTGSNPSNRSDLDAVGPNMAGNVWHHLGASFDRIGYGRIYVDGVLAGIRDVSAMFLDDLNPDPALNKINIGQDSTGHYDEAATVNDANDWSDLLVDDLAIWRKQLNAGDFQAIFNAGVANNDLSTVLGTTSAPADPDLVIQEFVWNASAYPTGNFGAVGPSNNRNWQDVFTNGINHAPGDGTPPATSITAVDRHLVDIDNAVVTLTDTRRVNGLDIAFNPTDTGELVIEATGNLRIEDQREVNIGLAGTGKVTMNGGTLTMVGSDDINIGAGTTAVGTLAQKGNSKVYFGEWTDGAPNDLGLAFTGGGDEFTTGEDDGGAGGKGTHTLEGTSEFRTKDDYWLADGSGTEGNLIMSGSSSGIIPDRLGIGDTDGNPQPYNGTVTLKDNAHLKVNTRIHMSDGPGSSSGTSTSTINIQDNAILDVGEEFKVGENGTNQVAIVNQSGGTVNMGAYVRTIRAGDGNGGNGILNNGDLKIAEGGGSSGTYNLSGGTLNGSRNTYVGMSGTGAFNQTGGTAHFRAGNFNAGTWSEGRAITGISSDSGGDLTIGQSGGSSGAYNISGTSTLEVDGDMIVASAGAGTLKISGGQANVQVGTGYTIDTGWTNTGERLPRAAAQGAFQVVEGNFTLGGSTGAGKLIIEITATGASGVKSHGNATIGANSTLEVVATALPATDAFKWSLVAADSDDDAAGNLTGNFTNKTIPVVVDPLGRKLRYLVEGEDKQIALGFSHDGDVNFDGVVDIFDVNVISDNWGTTNDAADANGDNIVDIFDVNLISDNWGNDVTGGGAQAVPEPSTVLLAGIGLAGLALAARRQRRRG